MRSAETTFRRLTIGEPRLLAAIADPDHEDAALIRLDRRTEALVQDAALVALDAPQSAYQAAVETALEVRATFDDLLAVLVAIAGSFEEIGDRLHVSRTTVKTQAIAICAKLGVSSRSEAIDRAIEFGLLEPFPGLRLTRSPVAA